MLPRLLRNLFVLLVLVVTLCASAFAQTREETDTGAFVIDSAGRYVRFEGRDGIVVDSLYAPGELTNSSGHTVHVNDKLALTVRYDGQDAVRVAGLPALTAIRDHEGRTTMVQADGKSVAVFEYTSAGLLAAATVPARLTWKVAPPDASHRVRQTIESGSGKIVATSLAKPVDNPQRGGSWLHALSEFGVDVESYSYEETSTNTLTIARDAKGGVAFYVVSADGCDVVFSPDGTPRFYDLTLRVWSGHMAPGSDLVISPAFDAQRGTVPDHLILTASGAIGLYSEEAAEDAITDAWVNRDGKIAFAKLLKREERKEPNE